LEGGPRLSDLLHHRVAVRHEHQPLDSRRPGTSRIRRRTRRARTHWCGRRSVHTRSCADADRARALPKETATKLEAAPRWGRARRTEAGAVPPRARMPQLRPRRGRRARVPLGQRPRRQGPCRASEAAPLLRLICRSSAAFGWRAAGNRGWRPRIAALGRRATGCSARNRGWRPRIAALGGRATGCSTGNRG
jgi:hypothetical protein